MQPAAAIFFDGQVTHERERERERERGIDRERETVRTLYINEARLRLSNPRLVRLACKLYRNRGRR